MGALMTLFSPWRIKYHVLSCDFDDATSSDEKKQYMWTYIISFAKDAHTRSFTKMTIVYTLGIVLILFIAYKPQ